VTRRHLFAAALAAGLVRPALAAGQDRDRAILRSLIAREQGAAFAYRGLRLPGLDDPAEQDADHAKALQTELQALYSGAAPLSSEKIDDAARRLRDASTATERRAAALALETELLAEYRDAVLDLAEPAILQTAATILACHAQRRALLTGASYPP
jgi:ferritin-like protein